MRKCRATRSSILETYTCESSTKIIIEQKENYWTTDRGSLVGAGLEFGLLVAWVIRVFGCGE